MSDWIPGNCQKLWDMISNAKIGKERLMHLMRDACNKRGIKWLKAIQWDALHGKYDNVKDKVGLLISFLKNARVPGESYDDDDDDYQEEDE